MAYYTFRADYWKSHAKKFCEFCKCWIADNKPSIGFHESGKRHKENVAKRLSEISKNSAKSFKEGLQVDREMKKMEADALKAYMKDLQENPDFTSKRIIEETERRKKELEESVRLKKEASEDKQAAKCEPESAAASTSTGKVWYEAKSDEGYTYYWNINTAESLWEPPPEGFLSIEEQDKQKKEAQMNEEMKRRKKEEKAKQKQEKREAMKKKRKVDVTEEVTLAAGPAPKPDPYGSWNVIEPKVEEPLDLQLPEQEYVAIKVFDIAEPEIKFKEKTLKSLDEGSDIHWSIKDEPDRGSTSFKKRKVNRANMRQKLDTD